MPSTESSGTQTAVIGTEHSLATITVARTLTLYVDTANMVNGDELELRVTKRVLVGGTNRLAYMASYAHIQAEPIKQSIPVISLFNAEFTLTQTVGTGRSFDWSVLSSE